MRVLLIEDDTALGAAIRDQIAADGHSVDWVTRLDRSADALAVAGYGPYPAGNGDRDHIEAADAHV